MVCKVCGGTFMDGVAVCPYCGSTVGENTYQPGSYQAQQGQGSYQAQQGQGGYQAQQGQGGYQPQKSSGQGAPGGSGTTPPKKKGKAGKIILISSIAAVLIGGAIFAYFFFFRGGSADKMVRQTADAIQEMDIEKILEVVSDDEIEYVRSKITASLPSDIDVSQMGSGAAEAYKHAMNDSPKDLKKWIIDYAQPMLSSFGVKVTISDLNIGEYHEGFPDEMRSELEKCQEYFNQVDEVGYVKVSGRISVSAMGQSKDLNGELPIPVYKKGGKWYIPVLVVSVAPALDRYLKKSNTAQDVMTAEMLSTAMFSSMANEAAYDDYIKYDKGSEVILVRVDADGTVSGYNGIQVPNIVKEMQMNLGNGNFEPRYKANGADHWLVGFNNSKAVVYIANKDETMKVELQPEIDSEYK